MAVMQIKDGFNGGSDNQLKINADGSINVNGGGGSSGNVNVHDASGNPIGSTSGALNVSITSGSTTVSGTVNTVESGLGAFKTSQYTITTSTVAVPTTPLANRSSLSLRVVAPSGVAVFVCDTNTSVSTNGYPLYNGDILGLDLTAASNIYVAGSANGATLYILEMAT